MDLSAASIAVLITPPFLFSFYPLGGSSGAGPTAFKAAQLSELPRATEGPRQASKMAPAAVPCGFCHAAGPSAERQQVHYTAAGCGVGAGEEQEAGSGQDTCPGTRGKRVMAGLIILFSVWEISFCSLPGNGVNKE